VHPDWTLRVPVLRPRGAAWIDAAVTGGIVAALASALHWQAGFPLWLAAAGGIGTAAVRARFRGRMPVSALRMSRDGAFDLRMQGGWRPVEWVGRWRGPRWLTLRGRVPAASGNGADLSDHVTFTVWQDALPPSAWRRVSLFTSRRSGHSSAGSAAGVP
jgi:hypothetical protein